MRDLTLIVPFYENPTMLQEQQRVWADYPRKYREHLHVIVVDDGSPARPALPVFERDLPVASYRLYRILVDVRWNWLTCRNLGVSEATTDWILMTDIDHVVPADTLKRLLKRRYDDFTAYTFARVSAPDLEPYKPHPNSWFMTRHLFDCAGGYDERFSGFYGTDSEFRARVQATATRIKPLSSALIRYPREVISDASTTTYLRKQPEDGAVRRIKAERARIPGWRPLRLTFPWERQV